MSTRVTTCPDPNDGCRFEKCIYGCKEDFKGIFCIKGTEVENGKTSDDDYYCDGKNWVLTDSVPNIKYLVVPAAATAGTTEKKYIPAKELIEEPSEYLEHPSNQFPIPFGSLSEDIRSVQSILAKYNDFTKEILTKGTKTAEYSEVEPVDGKYGPRTELAIRTAIMLVRGRKKELSTGGSDQIQLSKKDYDSILAEDFPKLLKDIKDKEKFDVAILNIKRQDPNIAMVESYKKDLFKIRKNRYKQLEKLVFERLVKECK